MQPAQACIGFRQQRPAGRTDPGVSLEALQFFPAQALVESVAQKSVERQQTLVKIEGTSQKSLQEAEQTLAAARTQQALLQIQSPLAGTVTKVNSKAGEAADLATVLAEVVDLDRLVVSANVPSTELIQLKIGEQAQLVAADSTNVVNQQLPTVLVHR